MEQQMIKVSVGDDNRNFKTHKAPVKSLPCTSIPTLMQFVTGRVPFLSLNQQCGGTEGKPCPTVALK